MDRGRGRRAQVIGQKVEVPANWRAPVFPKTPEDLEFLQEVCMSDSLFKSLNQSDVEMIMRAFQPVKFNQGSTIITQGDPGDKIYVIHTGECDIAVNGKSVMKAKRGVKFGELALLHNAPRAATVTAESPVNTFSLDGTTFKAIMMGKAQQDTKDYLGFIQEVRILQSLPKADQMRLIDALQEREYAAGARIIKEGDEGDYFYIIRDGEVKCTQEAAGGCEVSKRLTKGDFFGELALLSAERRAATVVATKKTQVRPPPNPACDCMHATAHTLC
jgi:cAMP-dependent protein kinase regulator